MGQLSVTPSGSADHPRRPVRKPDADDEPVLPQTTEDEREVGWGDEPGSGRRDAEWYRRERPPHHG